MPVTVGPGPVRPGPAARPLGSAIELPDGRWCARHLLVRIHAASRSRRRRRVEAVPVATYVRFLACWQHVAPGTRAEGRAGLLSVIEQLQGIEAPAGEWERHLLPARVAGYDPRWLDELCLAGQVAWGRLTPRPEPTADGDEPAHRGTSTPSPATPLALVCREDLGLDAGRGAGRARGGRSRPSGPSADLLAALRVAGRVLPLRAARGHRPARQRRRRGPVGPGVPGHRDGRRLLGRAEPAGRPGPAAWPRAGPVGRRAALGRARTLPGSGIGEGRWSLLPDAGGPGSGARARSPRSWPRPWPGSCWPAGASWPGRCGSASPTGSPGATWCGPCGGSRPGARPWAAGSWPASPASSTRPRTPPTCSARCTATPGRAAEVTVAGADPLNLTGGLLAGPRVPSVRNRSVRYRDGVPADPTAAAS